MGVVISYAAAAVFQMMGMTNPDGSAILNFSEVATASWVGLPPFQLCKFDPTAVMVMAPIALATMMEHIGEDVYKRQPLVCLHDARVLR